MIKVWRSLKLGLVAAIAMCGLQLSSSPKAAWRNVPILSETDKDSASSRLRKKSSQPVSPKVVASFFQHPASGVIETAKATHIIPAGRAGERTIVSAAWPMFHHDMEHTGLSTFDTSTDTGTLRWKFSGGLDGRTAEAIQPFSSPALSGDGTIYIGSWNGLSVISSRGTLRWTFRTHSSGESSSPAIGRDGTVYFGSVDSNLYAINPNGTLKWKFPTRGPASSPTVGVHGTIYFGSFDGNLYALKPNGTAKWHFNTGDKVPMTPAIASDGTIYFSSGALNPDGTLKWRLPSDVARLPRFSPPAVASDGTSYFGSTDGRMHALNPDGTLKWDFPIDRGYVFASPAIGRDGTLYFGVNGGIYFYALSPNGALKWKFRTGDNVLSSAAVGADGTIYFGSEDGNFYALSPDGTERWIFSRSERHSNRPVMRHVYTASAGSSPAVGADGTIYFASLDGQLYAIH
jgi:outer membrane protein assembly factor BamB